VRHPEPEPLVKKAPPVIPPTARQQVVPPLREQKEAAVKPTPAVPAMEKPASPTSTKPIADKPATPPPAKEEYSPLAAGSAIEQLQSNWSKRINEAPDGLSKTPTAALLRSARPISIENDTLVVSVKHKYYKEKMDILENQKTADKIVSSFMGHPCKVKCVYEHENNHLVKAALKMGAQVIEPEDV
jgi:hypothetical protein